MLTELGREVVCIIIGEYADALVACGILEWTLTESQLSSAIKASSRRKQCPENFPAAAGSADVFARPIPQTE